MFAAILGLLDNVPKLLTIGDPIGCGFRIEDAPPFRLAKVAVIANDTSTFIDQPLARVVGRSRDDVLAFAPFYNCCLDPVESHASSSSSRERSLGTLGLPNVW